jgi:hypothetical protein
MNFLNHKESKIIMVYHRDQRYNYPFFFSLFHINYFNFISHQFYFLIIQKKKKTPREGRVRGFQTGLKF